IFPEVLEPGTVVGEVTTKASNETGLTVDTKVVMGGADTQLALVAVGAVDAYCSTTIGGTFWQQTIVTEKPLIDPKIRLNPLPRSPRPMDDRRNRILLRTHNTMVQRR